MGGIVGGLIFWRMGGRVWVEMGKGDENEMVIGKKVMMGRG